MFKQSQSLKIICSNNWLSLYWRSKRETLGRNF